jgi:hypothetical protein
VLEGVLWPSTDPAVLRQEHPEPAGRDVHAGLLLQIGREPRGGPHIKDQAQRRGRRLQRRLQGPHVGRIRLHGPPRARRIGQRRHPACPKARQPVGHGRDRAPAPVGNPLHVIAQRRRFDHLQPLAHPPPEIGPAQLLLDLRALLWGDHDALRTHVLAPLLRRHGLPPRLGEG